MTKDNYELLGFIISKATNGLMVYSSVDGGFVNTQKYLRVLDYDKAIENIKSSKWAKQTPRRANNLIARISQVAKLS